MRLRNQTRCDVHNTWGISLERRLGGFWDDIALISPWQHINGDIRFNLENAFVNIVEFMTNIDHFIFFRQQRQSHEVDFDIISYYQIVASELNDPI